MLSLRFCRRCLPEIGLRRPVRAVFFFFVFSSPLCLFARYAWVPGLGCPARFWPQFVSAVFFFLLFFRLFCWLLPFFGGLCAVLALASLCFCFCCRLLVPGSVPVCSPMSWSLGFVCCFGAVLFCWLVRCSPEKSFRGELWRRMSFLVCFVFLLFFF